MGGGDPKVRWTHGDILKGNKNFEKLENINLDVSVAKSVKKVLQKYFGTIPTNIFNPLWLKKACRKSF